MKRCPTIWQELAFHRRFLPGITLAEINALAAQWFPAQNRLVIVTGPEAAGVALPDETQLAAAIRTASARPVDRYVDDGADQVLMPTLPAKGSIVKVTPRPEAGIIEWTLSNGATVVLKPTTLKEDQILFRAFAPGGTSLAGDADVIPARTADYVVPAGGVGQLSGPSLDKLLNGRAVAVTPFIGDTEQGMAGGSTPQDLETFFQLLHLRFTQPRADPSAFPALSAQVRALVANRAANPEVVFRQEIDAALTRNSPRRGPDTAGDGGAVGPGEVDGLLQGALRRRQPLHVRLRRQFHPRSAQAIRRNLPREPAGDARRRNVARRGHRAAARRRGAEHRERDRAEEPGGDRLLRSRSCTTTPICWPCEP